MSDQSTPGQAWACPMPSLLPVSTCGSSGTNDEENNGSIMTAPICTPPTRSPHKIPLIFGDDEEARLFMHYVQDLSSWVDICDPLCHFGLEVPRRAYRFPILSYGILAFSSRFISLVSGVSHGRAADYHSRAVQMLIPILDGPVEALDENVLAAIVLLRLYEERTDTDLGTHLYGSARLLNTASSLAATGGLGEAASWVVLRQDIYVSLTKSQPLYIGLDHYKQSSSFINNTAEALANRAVFICGQLLAYAFGSGTVRTTSTTLNIDDWTRLNDDANRWHMSMSADSTPFWVDNLGDQNQDGTASISAFPVIWVTRPAYIAAYQHYFLARILLAIFNPHLCKPSLNTLLERRDADEEVLKNLRLLVGLAISNPSVINASFTASHTLQACGSYFKIKREQDDVVKFLNNFGRRSGWRTARIVEELTAQWEERSHHMNVSRNDLLA